MQGHTHLESDLVSSLQTLAVVLETRLEPSGANPGDQVRERGAGPERIAELDQLPSIVPLEPWSPGELPAMPASLLGLASMLLLLSAQLCLG